MAAINNVLALDVGQVRIGVAIASYVAKIPRPLKTIANSPQIFQDLQNIVKSEDVQVIVVGLPRGLDGQVTDQTKTVEGFIEKLKNTIDLPVYTQDEALTSIKAEEELKASGKPYAKEDIDAFAATYILDDFLRENAEKLGQES